MAATHAALLRSRVRHCCRRYRLSRPQHHYRSALLQTSSLSSSQDCPGSHRGGRKPQVLSS